MREEGREGGIEEGREKGQGHCSKSIASQCYQSYLRT